jgi:hypothetical protein
MTYSGGLTSVRRAVGVAVVLLLLICALFYAVVAGFPTFGLRAATPVSSYASPLNSGVASRSPSTDGSSGSADPSRASDPTPSASATTPGAGNSTAAGSGEGETIQVVTPAGSGKPFEAVRIRGTYRGGPDTVLRVQRWEGGMWLDFPVPTKSDRSGRFTAYVELGLPGRYWLRVLDPDSGAQSKPFQLVIKK